MGEWKKSQCNFCGLSCGLELYVDDNKITDVRPDPDSPRNPESYCCRKGRSTRYFTDHDERLNHPLKRVGDHFEQISWEQAYAEIAEKTNALIEEYGPRCFAYCGGALATMQGDLAIAKPMVKLFGSQYVYNPTGLEFAGSWWSHGKIYGDQMRYTEADADNVDVFVAWGSNAYVSHQIGEARTYIRRMSEDPDKVVVSVDPRLSETARMADLHIMLRPGTDALLVRGMIALILDRGWQDQAYLDTWAADFDKVRPWFTGFDYRAAFETCRVPFDQAERFVKLLCTKTWGMHEDLGVFCGRHNTATCYLLDILMAVTGNLFVKGNIVHDGFCDRGISINEDDPKVWRTVATNQFPVLDTYPTAVMAEEILSDNPEHLRVLFCSNANPVRSWPDTHRMREAMEKLDLLVVVDICMSETARYADYVLPGKTGFESYDFNTFQSGFPEVTCQMKYPVLDQVGERKENSQIWFDICDAAGRVPELPESLYQAAQGAVAVDNRVGYFVELFKHVKQHPEQMPLIPFIVSKTLGAAMGSVNKSLMWAALVTSPLAATGEVQRAGWKPAPALEPIIAQNPKLAGVCLMDTVFTAVEHTPQGVVVAVSEPDKQAYTYRHILHDDHKLHLWCRQIDEYLPCLEPDAEERALAEEQGDFPLVLSAGSHADGGDNGIMRNPATYVYRDPYHVTINPHDADELGISEHDPCRVETRAGSIKAPAHISATTCRGYVVVPHQFGFAFDGKTYGDGVNELTAWEDHDRITGNPLFRHVPCRVVPEPKEA